MACCRASIRARVRPSLLPLFAVTLLALTSASCFGDELAPTIWPPPDFGCEVEEVALREGVPQVVRRFRVENDGICVYGTAATSRVDATSGAALPVFDRLVVYRLVPECVRAFARRIDRLGVLTLDNVQGERGVASDTGLVLRWRAFGNQKTIVARGRVFGAMAEILAIVTSHLPDDERFALPGFAERQVVSVLRGVPAPLTDARLALAAHEELLAERPDDRAWLLDAFALACAVGERAAAEDLLRRWSALEAAQAASGPGAAQGSAAGSGASASAGGLTADLLRRLLPPQ
jgi:hypothetical protein